jgi:hypothetical protein
LPAAGDAFASTAPFLQTLIELAHKEPLMGMFDEGVMRRQPAKTGHSVSPKSHPKADARGVR